MLVATVFVNLSALRHNLQRLREYAPASQIIAIVKANAYGHGMVETAKALREADAFGVARIAEALKLRAAGVSKPILLLEGFFQPEDLALVTTHRLTTAVHTLQQLEALEQADLETPVGVWLKVDTGMHRLGVLPEQADSFYQRLSQCKNVIQPVNIMSHFARADELACDSTEQQIAIFDRVCANKDGERSIAASAGTLFWPQSHYDWVRPGIIMYGVSPLEGHPWAEELGFRPAMRFCSQLIAVREHRQGEPVGYGAQWYAESDTRLGVIALGYGDGYPRSAPSGTPVWINGREVPIVGRVSMDMICVDLGPDAQDKPGDAVEMWGENLPVERIAEYTKVSAYELITRLTARTAIEYLD